MTTTRIHSGHLLPLALRLDAAASGAMGLGLAAASPLADNPLGVPAGWLVGLGIFLVAWAALLAAIAARRPIPAGAAWGVIAGNAVWVIASVVTVLADWFPLTGLGTALALLQAAAVVVLLVIQYVGLQRA